MGNASTLHTYRLYCSVHKEFIGIDLQDHLEIEGEADDNDLTECVFHYKEIEVVP